MTTEVAAPTTEAPVIAPDPVTRVLRNARAILIEHGWCQGVAGDTTGRRCSYGAIAQALIHDPVHTAHAPLRDPATLLDAVITRFTAAAGCPDELASLVDWNDDPDRTFAEVIETFGRAIGEAS